MKLILDGCINLRAGFSLLIVFFLTGCGAETSSDTASDMEAITERVLELENAMNLAVDSLQCAIPEAGAFEPIFVTNALVIRSATELRSICEAMVAPRANAVFNADRITANVLSGDAAFVTREGNYTINYLDGTSETTYMVMTTIWQQNQTGWKLAHLHESFREL